MSLEQILKLIKKGVEEIVSEEDLIKKLNKSAKTGVPLRVKYGIDPTGFDVHIGHLVPIRKMREFQDLGHTGVIIIGDFTARIGDPTGRDESRPPLSPEQVEQNASKYMEQMFTILDPAKTEIRRQTEWFGSMGMDDVLKLMGKFTLAQFLAHDTFRKRYDDGLPLGMHEIMYPILQAYDSVAVKADIELGATEQKFNILKGRDMLRYFGMEEQVAVLSPILLGTDGVAKMSKSMNNYIAVFDTPTDKYGKVMSIPDAIIVNYFKYATKVSPEEIEEIEQRLKTENPKFIKQRLAREIVAMYHGIETANATEEEFNRVFSQKEIPADIQEFPLEGKIWIVRLLTDSGVCKSGGEARRMIAQGAVRMNDETVTNPEMEVEAGEEIIFKIGKRRFLKVVPKHV